MNAMIEKTSKSLALLLISCVMCTSVSGCLLAAAAGAGAAGGYIAGQHSEDKEHHEDVEVHEYHHDTE
ncbi:MAG TPA: hypothetical protein VH518_09000 [Tepidisphaeraceae bacterium]|jgi:hypothetical protein